MPPEPCYRCGSPCERPAFLWFEPLPSGELTQLGPICVICIEEIQRLLAEAAKLE